MRNFICRIFIGISLLLVLSSCGGGGGGSSEPNVEVTFPENSEVVARSMDVNDGGYIDYYGSSIDEINKVVGNIDGQSFEVTYYGSAYYEAVLISNGNKYSYDTNGNFYINDIYQFESSLVDSRVFTHEEECEIQARVLDEVITSLLLAIGGQGLLEHINEKASDNPDLNSDIVAFYLYVKIQELPRVKAAMTTYKEECIDYVEELDNQDNVNNSSLYYKPTLSACENAGGSWNNDYDECLADWDEAMSICEIPSIEMWEAVITGCGGVVDEYTVNQGNDTYQQCYKDLGYIRDGAYTWSSTMDASNTNNAWRLNIYSGGVGVNSKRSNFNVRCVR